jgi:hypothetical protein
MGSTEIIIEPPIYRVLPVAVEHEDLMRHTVPLLRLRLDSGMLAPCDGAAAAAPEGGALATPSTPISTSTRWALVTVWPCQAWHGRGLNEVPAVVIRAITSYREALYGGFWKSKYPYTSTETSRSGHPIWFLATEYPLIHSRQGGGGGVCEIFFGERG